MAGGAWRVVQSALNAAPGELVTHLPQRRRPDDCAAFARGAGAGAPRRAPRCWSPDNAPPHHPKRVQAAAAAAYLQVAFLPFSAPELLPGEDLWRLAKVVVAANRVYQTVQEQAERAIAWLHVLSPYKRLLKAGLFGLKFQWLST